jgi:hypothetical protein
MFRLVELGFHPSLVQKNSSTQFTLLVNPSDIPSGVRVVAKWIEGFISATQGHKGSHEVGGFDEIDVTKLKNYQESISTPISNLTTQLAQKASGQDVSTLQTDVNTVKSSLAEKVKKGELFINVQDYGAKGDGIANDSQSITDAINKLISNGGGTLFFPYGNYKCNNALGVFSGSNIEINLNGSTLDFSSVPPTTFYSYIGFKGTYGVTKNLTGNGVFATKVITVADTSGLVAGDMIRVYSNKQFDSTRTQSRIGEIVFVDTVDSSTQITLKTSLNFDYNTT